MRSIAIALVLLWSAAAGAVPRTINFTGRLTTSTGPVNGAVNVTLKLYAEASGGAPLWTEIHNNVGASNGLVFLDAGTLTSLDEAILDGRRLYLEIVVETETLAPRLALNSVPYAVRTDAAATADLLGGSIGAGDVITSVTGAAGVAANKTGNAVTVGLTTSGCTNGQVYKFSNGTFACGNDATTSLTPGNGIAITNSTISLATTSCSNGQVYKFNSGAFSCQADAVATLTAGTGIDVNGSTISLSTTGCTPGSVWKFVNGSFSCQPDLAAGNGISIANSTVSLATTNCANGQVYKFNSGTFACANDATGSVSGAAPISVSGTTVSLSGCATNQILRWTGTAWACSTDLNATSCIWKVATGSAASTNQRVACPTGRHPVSGGCDAAGTAAVTISRPFGPPADGAASTSVIEWFCEFNTSLAGHTAYALCCDTI